MNVKARHSLVDRPDHAPGPDCPNINLVGRRKSRVEELQAQVGILLKAMRIAVVYGGDKNDDGAVIYKSSNPRSWKSYESVARDIAKKPSAPRRRQCLPVPRRYAVGGQIA